MLNEKEENRVGTHRMDNDRVCPICLQKTTCSLLNRLFTLEPGRFGLLQAHLLQEVHSGVDEENRVLSAVQTKRGGDYCGHRLSLSVLSIYAERVSPLLSLRPKT